MKNKRQFSEFITLIGEKYGVEISKLMSKTIWQALESFSNDDCEKAFNHVIAHGRFYKDLMPDLLGRLEGSEQDKNLRAWIKTIKAVREIGNGESVQFDDPIIHSVIEAMGGWINTGEWLQKDEKWIQKEFIALYRVAEKQNTHPGYLIGEFEDNNKAQFPQFVRPPARVCENDHGEIQIYWNRQPLKQVVADNQRKMLKSE